MAKIEGLSVVVSGFDQLILEGREAAYRGVVEAMQVAFKACYHLLSEEDHTLLELAALGHPYSRTHGFAIHQPDEIIHVQSGAYRDGLRAIPPTGYAGEVVDGRIVNVDRKDRWLQEGTTKMRARPYMAYVVQHFGDQMADLIIARIREAIRRRAA